MREKEREGEPSNKCRRNLLFLTPYGSTHRLSLILVLRSCCAFLGPSVDWAVANKEKRGFPFPQRGGASSPLASSGDLLPPVTGSSCSIPIPLGRSVNEMNSLFLGLPFVARGFGCILWSPLACFLVAWPEFVRSCEEDPSAIPSRCVLFPRFGHFRADGSLHISRKGGSFAPIDQLGNDIDIGFPCLISGWLSFFLHPCVSRGITGASISCRFRNEMLCFDTKILIFLCSTFYAVLGHQHVLECFCMSFFFLTPGVIFEWMFHRCHKKEIWIFLPEIGVS